MRDKRLHTPWFEKNPKLFAKQTEILNAAAFSLDEEVLRREGRIQFAGNSKVEPSRQLIIAFPNAFPSSAPKIYDTPESKLLARHHRIDSRQLCLFGFNENRWCAGLSVSEALAEAEQLISEFKDLKPGQQHAAPEPITRLINYTPETAILVPPPISTFDDFDRLQTSSGKFSGKFVHQGDPKRQTLGRGIVLEANFGHEKRKGARPFTEFLQNNGKEIHGDWFYLKDPPTQENLRQTFDAYFKKCKALKKADFYWIALVFREEARTGGEHRFTWLIARANAKGELHVIRTFPYIQGERYARIPGLEGLATKRITLVGAGSLGSKIATNLGASGVNIFRIVDFDYYEPNNSVRHELGVENFGLAKAQALFNRLSSLNPETAAKSTAHMFQVASISSFEAEEQFYELVKDSDLIVDATGVHSVSHFLNHLAFELRIPLVIASVTNGAWGGEIVRIVPGKTPCWVCWLDEYDSNPPPSAPQVTGEVFAPGCDQPTFTGTTYDIGIVANLATSMCVETILASPETDLSQNYIRWSGKDKDGKPLYLIEKLSTHAQPGCWCQDS